MGPADPFLRDHTVAHHQGVEVQTDECVLGRDRRFTAADQPHVSLRSSSLRVMRYTEFTGTVVTDDLRINQPENGLTLSRPTGRNWR